MKETIWSRKAKLDLQDIYDFIAEDSIFYAEKQIKRLLARGHTIYLQPMQGLVVREIKNMAVREIFEGSYRIIYHTNNLPEIIIIRVFHKSRMLKKL